MKVSLSGNLGRYVDFDCEIDLEEGPDQRRGVGRLLPGLRARGPEMARPIRGNGSGSAPSGLDRAIKRTPDKAETILARGLHEFRAGIEAGLGAVKPMAEQSDEPVDGWPDV